MFRRRAATPDKLPEIGDLTWVLYIQEGENVLGTPWTLWRIETPTIIEDTLEEAKTKKRNYCPGTSVYDCDVIYNASVEDTFEAFMLWAKNRGLSLSNVLVAKNYNEVRELLTEIYNRILNREIYGQWPFNKANGHKLITEE